MLQYFERFFFGKSALSFDILGERASIAVLVDEIIVAWRAKHFHELDDIGMRYLCKDVDLVVGELSQLWSLLEFISAHHFHRIEQLCLFVLGPINIAVLP